MNTSSEILKKNRDEKKSLLKLLVRAAEFYEEVYAVKPELVHDDGAQEYKDIVSAINAGGITYKANPKIVQHAHDFVPAMANKLPLVRVKSRLSGIKDNSYNKIAS